MGTHVRATKRHLLSELKNSDVSRQ